MTRFLYALLLVLTPGVSAQGAVPPVQTPLAAEASAVLDEARLALRASKIDASNLRVTGVPSSSGHPTQTNNSPSHARPLPLHQRVHCSQPLRSGCHVEVVESAIA